MRNIIQRLKRKLELFLYTSDERRHSMVGPAKLWKMKRAFQIHFLKQVGLEPRDYLLDVGCGTLRGGIPIIDYLKNGRYYGIEIRGKALDEGKKELEESGLLHKHPGLFAADYISSVKIERKFNYIWSYSVLIHMSDQILYDVLSFVNKYLEDNGFFYANVIMGNQPDSSWQGFPVVHRSLSFYEEACSRNGLKLNEIGQLKDFGHISGIKSQDEQHMLEIMKV